PPYDPRARQPNTLGELERWLHADEVSKRGSLVPFPIALNPPPIPGLDRLSAYCAWKYGDHLSVETVRRLIGEYALTLDISTDQAKATSLKDVADALARQARSPNEAATSGPASTSTSSVQSLCSLFRGAANRFPRLGFALVLGLNPEIVLLDETLLKEL